MAPPSRSPPPATTWCLDVHLTLRVSVVVVWGESREKLMGGWVGQSGGRLSTWMEPVPIGTLSTRQEPSLAVWSTVESPWGGWSTTRTPTSGSPSESEILPFTVPTNGPFALFALQAATMATMAIANGILRFMRAKVFVCTLLVH
jgi:hypothetical protein